MIDEKNMEKLLSLIKTGGESNLNLAYQLAASQNLIKEFLFANLRSFVNSNMRFRIKYNTYDVRFGRVLDFEFYTSRSLSTKNTKPYYEVTIYTKGLSDNNDETRNYIDYIHEKTYPIIEQEKTHPKGVRTTGDNTFVYMLIKRGYLDGGYTPEWDNLLGGFTSLGEDIIKNIENKQNDNQRS